MQGRIPEDIIDKVRDEVAIQDVIGHFVALQQKGTSYWGLCPFHSEKTPSFHVHPDRQIFYCFGCGRGGNVFRFLMDREGMSFPEAVQWCASRIGLDLDRFLQEDDARADARNRLLEANAWAAKWFREQLLAPAGAGAREYCRDRGLRPETLEAFTVGLAPDGDTFVRAAAQVGLNAEVLLQTQLLRRKEGAAPFAYFRKRLIFPIRGVAQKVYGFGGRILGPGEPKYLNSPETSVFQKRKVLYALADARAQIIRGKAAILVEGYLDALALHQAGFTNTVATCGTAFTPEQAAQVGRFADRVVLLFDGDTAGTKAAFRAADVALAAGLDVRMPELPAGKDPADLVQSGEVEALRAAIDDAVGIVPRMRAEVDRRGGHREMKERALHQIQTLLTKIPDPIRAELILHEAAEVFSVPKSLLRGARPSAAQHGESLPQDQGPRAELERSLLSLALTGRKARHHLVQKLTPADFHVDRHRKVFVALQEVDDHVDQIRDGMLADLDDDGQRTLARLLLEMPEAEFDAAAELSATLEQLARMEARERSRERLERLNEVYRTGGDWQKELRRDVAPESE
jgi:DNA primase